MTGYVIGGWSAAFALTGLYAWRTLRRSRLLARRLTPDTSSDRP